MSKVKKIFSFSMIVILLIGIVIFYLLFTCDFSSFGESQLVKNIKVLNEFLLVILPLLLIMVLIWGFWVNRFALKIEKLTLGGFNILFDNPADLYVRSVKSFLDTKRTLFFIDPSRDNFDETLTSYYNTYEFFRNEMKILDNKEKKGRRLNQEQKKLYVLTNEIIHKLNDFLTSHQNNYRRWYKHVSDEDMIKLPNGEEIIVHSTPINKVQEQYYRYEEICKGFQEINVFFRDEVNKKFKINLKKWGVGSEDA
ncbi:hypothetical protein R4T60_15855 [Bacillus paralicheniformis]|uniref:hypothetical protein n=1 Tax=Bacillus paralicheniformis TaxID=1648923 RepID=UPI00298CE071|nr:hypothetical protein [Bacillus paralicheniformis]MDW6055660.1 hypothetical protein [Bacillus paralicheniformis]